MIWVYVVFAFIVGLMCGFLYAHLRKLDQMLDYDIDIALRRAREVGYWTRAMEESND